ncbi:MAG: hypothetical protein NTV68_14710 [Methanomicrobiales archaeon]|nr:hypothetical protein [Methanomicrobiales archaeon]
MKKGEIKKAFEPPCKSKIQISLTSNRENKGKIFKRDGGEHFGIPVLDGLDSKYC